MSDEGKGWLLDWMGALRIGWVQGCPATGREHFLRVEVGRRRGWGFRKASKKRCWWTWISKSE